MKKPVEKDIGDHKYQIYLMGVKRQIKMIKFITSLIGKPIGALSSLEDEVDEEGKKKSLLDNTKVIGLFIEAVIESFDDEKMISQIEGLLEFIKRYNPDTSGYAQVQMETGFHGELDHLFEVVAVVLEVNFGSFLGGSTGLINKLKVKFANKNKK